MIEVVKMPIPLDERTVYIGRAFRGNYASPLANPYILKGATREQVIAQYRDWLMGHLPSPYDALLGPSSARIEFDRLVELARTGDLRLACWCAPLPCHGDVIKELIEARLKAE